MIISKLYLMIHNMNCVYVYYQELRRYSAIHLDAFFNLCPYRCLLFIRFFFFLTFTIEYFLVLNHNSFIIFVLFFNKEILHFLFFPFVSIKNCTEIRIQIKIICKLIILKKYYYENITWLNVTDECVWYIFKFLINMFIIVTEFIKNL